MPVTISAIVTESWSSSSAILTWKFPATIHCHSTTSWLRSSAGRPSMVTNIQTATPKLSSTMPGASHGDDPLAQPCAEQGDDKRPHGGE